MPLGFSYLELNNAIHHVEEMAFPMPSAKTIAIATAVGIPLSIVLHDSSNWWTPKKFSLPIVSYFQRRWQKDPKAKLSDLTLARNAVVFAWIAAMLHEPLPKQLPLDYVSDRLSNTTTRKVLTDKIQQARVESYVAANDVMAAAAMDGQKAQQLRDTALHRRHVQTP